MRALRLRAWHPRTGMQTAEQMRENDLTLDFTGKVIFNNYVVESLWHVMQFTGLKDKNGVDIYEGDIVYISGYGDYECVYPFIELYEASTENDIGSIKGNIYENPKLLNK